METKETAIFAGGCFWCMVHPFDERDGVLEVVSGYTGGDTVNPTYEEVCSGQTGHAEAVKIDYDPSKINYQDLLTIYWSSVDPTDKDGQFGDRGSSYRPEIFYTTAAQKEAAERSKAELEASNIFKKPIIVPISPAQPFYPAEDYHQDFHHKEPAHYQNFYKASGRKQFVETTQDKMKEEIDL
ncbi:peptide-methionine (S)-S-oxide reductase MsrA [Facklamia miroungae]|uniref:Peptide methionine sulfoxide reductase MsrA n=1 Tax=Facklamia miroungae TaxID=120956 RepID=A0A1G7SZD4_9LACT|nr:peptide-methionine (S)-S-oxide reductase MsrA [Facklamia miroungae]NKZ29476.1 peptide-methionine (S)-S-oxide reductase MsrA [Facklamia miroungae]SDG28318.1 peptide-methionine (S)-S-oxide reductase [Facklamia miroungae]